MLTCFFKSFLKLKRLSLERADFLGIFERKVIVGKGKRRKEKQIIWQKFSLNI